MKRIRFSHRFYLKLPKVGYGATAFLLAVFTAEREGLPKPFIEYDTKYFDEEERKWKYYPLPPGRVLILVFNAGGHIFTTIRRHTPRKESYYRKGIGEPFVIEFVGKTAYTWTELFEIIKKGGGKGK